MTQKLHDMWDLRCPGDRDVYHCLIIWPEEYMILTPLGTPLVQSSHYGEKVVIGNGLMQLQGTHAPLSHSVLK